MPKPKLLSISGRGTARPSEKNTVAQSPVRSAVFVLGIRIAMTGAINTLDDMRMQIDCQ